MADEGKVLGDVGTRVVLEKDRVKIWEMDLQPGEESDEHRHDRDYILVLLEGDRIAGISTDGRDDIYADVRLQGDDFERTRVTTDAEQRALVTAVRRALA